MPLTALNTTRDVDNDAKRVEPTVASLEAQQEQHAPADLFHSVSSQLADTYHEMEERVGLLSQELHQVAQQRLDELHEKERVTQRLESLLKLLPAGVVVLDSQGVVSECNPAAIELLGEPLVEQLWRDIIQRSFSPKGDDGHEISLKDGRRISLVTRSFGSEGGQLILLTDLTETRELQRNLSRHRRLSEMGRMMSSLAHQIRTPLSAAMLYAGHLCDSALSVEQTKRFSQKVLSRLNHLDQQVKDMLIFVRGDVKLTDRLSVAELIIELESAMEIPMSSSRSCYRVEMDCPDVFVQCNRESMVGALMNLVTNAIQAVGRQAELLIKVGESEGRVNFHIADKGPGISPDIQANLAEPFYTTKPQGTGLGLAVVRAVVQAHQGDFNLISAPGQGCCVVISLPVVDSAVSLEAHTHAN